MKVLALSDIHLRWEKFAPSDMPQADVALVAGDLTEWGCRGEPTEVACAGRWLTEMGRRYAAVFWIPGNHDVGIGPDTFRLPDNVRCVLGRTVSLPTSGETRPLTLRGVCLCPAYEVPELAERFAYTTTDPAAEERAYDFEAVDVVLSHCPPLGTLDFWADATDALGPRPIGSRALTAYVHRCRPRLVVCGHVHVAAGQATLNSTQVCNVAARYLCLDL